MYTVFNQRTWACSSWRLGSNPDYSSFTSYQWCLNKNLSPWGKKAFFWDNSKEKHISTTRYQWISIFIIIYKCIIITANNNDITFISWLVNSFSKDQQEDFWMILYCSSWTVILYEHWQVMEDWKCPSWGGGISAQVEWAPGCAEGCWAVICLCVPELGFIFQFMKKSLWFARLLWLYSLLFFLTQIWYIKANDLHPLVLKNIPYFQRLWTWLYFQSKRSQSCLNVFHVAAVFCRISGGLVCFILLLLLVLSIFLCFEMLIAVSQNHRMDELGRDLWISFFLTPPAQAGSPIAGCPGPSPDGFWVSPMMETLPPVFPAFSHTHSEKVFLNVHMEPPVFQFLPIASTHFERYS